MTITPAYRYDRLELTGPVYDIRHQDMYCNVRCARLLRVDENRLVEQDPMAGDECACCGKPIPPVEKG